MAKRLASELLSPSTLQERVHLRVVSRNDDLGNWDVVGETDDGRPAVTDVVGVQDVGDGIDAASARGVELRISDEVYSVMHDYKDAWYPRPPSVKR